MTNITLTASPTPLRSESPFNRLKCPSPIERQLNRHTDGRRASHAHLRLSTLARAQSGLRLSATSHEPPAPPSTSLLRVCLPTDASPRSAGLPVSAGHTTNVANAALMLIAYAHACVLWCERACLFVRPRCIICQCREATWNFRSPSAPTLIDEQSVTILKITHDLIRANILPTRTKPPRTYYIIYIYTEYIIASERTRSPPPPGQLGQHCVEMSTSKRPAQLIEQVYRVTTSTCGATHPPFPCRVVHISPGPSVKMALPGRPCPCPVRPHCLAYSERNL